MSDVAAVILALKSTFHATQVDEICDGRRLFIQFIQQHMTLLLQITSITTHFHIFTTKISFLNFGTYQTILKHMENKRKFLKNKWVNKIKF